MIARSPENAPPATVVSGHSGNFRGQWTMEGQLDASPSTHLSEVRHRFQEETKDEERDSKALQRVRGPRSPLGLEPLLAHAVQRGPPPVHAVQGGLTRRTPIAPRPCEAMTVILGIGHCFESVGAESKKAAAEPLAFLFL